MNESLGFELKRLRTAAGLTLRTFATKVGISPAHLSDLEHDRRRPSPALITRLASALRHVGARREDIERLNTRLDPQTQEWMTEHPGARQLLRVVRDSGRDPNEILKELEAYLKREKS